MNCLRIRTYTFRQASIFSTEYYSQRVKAVSTRAYNSRTGSSTKPSPTANPSGLDPDKIKGPGGLTMTQIGKLIQESRAKDLEHQAKQQQQQQQSSKSSKQ